ncbi:MAG: flippase-like domain-containing protein [Leadbetterella sp.]|nr:flippase-like domain-containing protein [Leadbetterella sp.]
MITALLLSRVLKLDLSGAFLRELGALVRPGWILAGILLVLPNYYLEITKWKILGRLLEDRDFSTATTEVLRGLKLGVVTPLMAGDYLGRSMDFKKENRMPAVLLNLYNSLTQTWTALLFGGAALSLWYFREKAGYLVFPAALISGAAVVGLGFLYGLQPAAIQNWPLLQKWPWLRKYTAAFSLPLAVKNRVIGLSVLRSIIYNLQYVCFYLGFGITLAPGIFFIGINLLLLAKTVGGGLNIFGDLTLRELISLPFFKLYHADERLILVATFAVWFFSVFAPVLTGIFYKPRKNDPADRV